MKTRDRGGERLSTKLQLMLMGRYNPKQRAFTAREQRRREEQARVQPRKGTQNVERG